MAINYAALIQSNQQRWVSASFKQSFLSLAGKVAQRLTADKAKAAYQALEQITNVPWFIIAVIHEREASQRWDRNIAQGDPWNATSTHVPKGRGPFKSFQQAAIDALTNCPPFAARWKDWSPGGALTLLELYNGLGYENAHHMASPYLWSGTQHYRSGKYVADSKFDPNAVDSQLGCAVLLKKMMVIDKSIFAPTQSLLAVSEEPNPDEYPGTVAAEAPDDPPEPEAPAVAPDDAEGPTGKVVTARAAAGTGAALLGGGQVVSSIVGPANDIADQFTSVVDKSGTVIDATKQIVAVPKPGFWFGVLHMVTSPTFIIGAVLLIAAAWGLVWFWQRQHRQSQQ